MTEPTDPPSADLAEITKLRHAYENAELAALRELMKDLPENIREALREAPAQPDKTYEIYF
jgi:hypothetical protein